CRDRQRRCRIHGRKEIHRQPHQGRHRCSRRSYCPFAGSRSLTIQSAVPTRPATPTEYLRWKHLQQSRENPTPSSLSNRSRSKALGPERCSCRSKRSASATPTSLPVTAPCRPHYLQFSAMKAAVSYGQSVTASPKWHPVTV